WFSGGELSLVLQERFALGIAFQGLTSAYTQEVWEASPDCEGEASWSDREAEVCEVSEASPDCEGEASRSDREAEVCVGAPDGAGSGVLTSKPATMRIATATMEYMWWAQNRWNVSTQLQAGVGSIQAHDALFRPLLVLELRTRVFYDIYPWLQAGMGMGYRVVREVVVDGSGRPGSNFDGMSGNLMLRLTLF
ncbi:MAG: hypothetical protein AAGI01_10135, partial [Myxococcota bacterium]